MVKKIALFYREFMLDYVVDSSGRGSYQPNLCTVFTSIEKAAEYLRKEYGQRKSELILGRELPKDKVSELERKLSGSKIKIKRGYA